MSIESIEKEFETLLESIPKELLELEGINELDMLQLSRMFFKSEDVASVSIDPNGNVKGKTPNGYLIETAKPIFKYLAYNLLWKHLKNIYGIDYANKIITAIIDGTIYFHDMSIHINKYYCFGTTTSHILCGGMPFLPLPSAPPKKLRSFMSQVRQATDKMSNELAGAIGFSDLFCSMAYYTKNMKDEDIIDELQDFTHSKNLNVRVTNDSGFCNTAIMDEPTFKEVFRDKLYPDFTHVTENYEEVNRIQKLFLKFYCTGSPITGAPYGFPVVTYCYSLDEAGNIIDKELFDFVCDLNHDTCVINFHSGSSISNCCRLNSDISALKEHIRFDSFGNGGESVGSSRVVTVNLHRIGLIALRDNRDFKAVLTEALEMCEMALVAHRDILELRQKQGLFEFFNNGWCHPSMFFNTIGYIGMYEAYTLSQEWDENAYGKFVYNVIAQIESFAKEAGVRNEKYAFNVEEIPGENAASVLAKKDRLLFDTEIVLLSNQTIPLTIDVPLDARMRLSGLISNMVSGGSILHINVGSSYTKGATKELTKMLAEKYKIQHFALNKVFASCENGHATISEDEVCPKCGGKIVDYITRVVGYFSKVKNWSPARRTVDFPKRQWYNTNT